MSINCLAHHGLVPLDYPATGSGKLGQLEVKVGCIVTMNIESNDLFVLYYIIYEWMFFSKKKKKERKNGSKMNKIGTCYLSINCLAQ